MKLIVGLGNPGLEYIFNRHNIGFMAVDEIVKYYNFTHYRKKFNALISEGRFNFEKIFVIKPQTYMNLSGESVNLIMRFYKLKPENLIVLHDEIDLLPTKIKVKFSGGTGGHNGLKSLDKFIGNKYYRVRIGVGRPLQKNQINNYVLSNFTKLDKVWIKFMIFSIAKFAPKLLLKNINEFKIAVEELFIRLYNKNK